MYNLRIQKGKYKGRLIQAPVPVQGISNSTPSRIKEAVFQILEVRIQDKTEYTFFDLCSGSGQIAFEALSQGFERVHLSELDQDRFSSILKEVKKNNFKIILHKKNFLKMIPLIETSKKSIIYLDLPYSLWTDGKSSQISHFFEVIEHLCLEKRHILSGFIFIQSPNEYIPESTLNHIKKLSHRSYGSNSITLFEFFSGSKN